MSFEIGSKVYFGRPNGQQTLGTVVGKGRTKYKVRQDEQRGEHRNYPVGTVWTVPPSLMRPASGLPDVASDAPKAGLSFGQPVVVNIWTWGRGEADVRGVVTKPGPASSEVYAGGRFVTLPNDKIVAGKRRTPAEAIPDFQAVYVSLSPENLSCDGERSRSETAAAYSRLNNALRALIAECGRRVTEDEAYRTAA